MIENALLRPYQQEALAIMMARSESGEQKTLISMPIGSGKTMLLMAFLENYVNAAKSDVRILIIANSKGHKQELSDTTEEYFSGNVGEFEDRHSCMITVALRSEVEKGMNASDLFFKEINLMIYPDLENSLHEKIWEEMKIFGWVPQLAITSLPGEVKGFGKPDFIYSIEQAIKDNIMSTPEIISIRLGMSEHDEIIHRDFLAKEGRQNSMRSDLDMPFSETYFDVLCAEIIERTQNEKTLILCKDISYAQQITEKINTKLEARRSAATLNHNIPADEANETLRKFNDVEATLNYLVVVSMTSIIKRIALIQNLVPLVGNLSNRSLYVAIQSSLRINHKDFRVKILDYTGIADKIVSYLGSDFGLGVKNITVGRKILLESAISFRDKKDIDAVLSAEDLAAEIAEIIKIIPAEQGSMLGVFGNWGRGKTFLMDLIWKSLVTSNKFFRVDFHAWRYQDTPATWAYLYERLSDRYFEQPEERCWIFKKIDIGWKTFKLNCKRLGVTPFFKLLGVFSIAVLLWTIAKLIFKGNSDALNSLKIPAIASTITVGAWQIFNKDYSVKAKDLFLKYSTKHSFKDQLGMQAEVQKETIHLLKSWIPNLDKGKKIVIFVDDIDRCNDSKVIQIIDSLRVLLEEQDIADRVVIISAIDDRFLKLAIKTKYSGLLSVEKRDQESHVKELEMLTTEYMDKLFIAGIRLGRLSINDRDEFAISLLKKDRRDNMVSKPLDEIIANERAIGESRMNAHLQDALMMHQIEAQQEQQDFDENMLEYEYQDDYYPEYINGSNELISDGGQSLKGKLAEEEVDILRYAISLIPEATPRQIRIFYYRYLLAKNLLARRYRSIKKNNIWMETRNSLILAKLIVKYQTNGNSSLLDVHLEEVSKSKSANFDIKMLDKVVVATHDYFELLKVLDIVIAY